MCEKNRYLKTFSLRCSDSQDTSTYPFSLRFLKIPWKSKVNTCTVIYQWIRSSREWEANLMDCCGRVYHRCNWEGFAVWNILILIHLGVCFIYTPRYRLYGSLLPIVYNRLQGWSIGFLERETNKLTFSVFWSARHILCRDLNTTRFCNPSCPQGGGGGPCQTSTDSKPALFLQLPLVRNAVSRLNGSRGPGRKTNSLSHYFKWVHGKRSLANCNIVYIFIVQCTLGRQFHLQFCWLDYILTLHTNHENILLVVVLL